MSTAARATAAAAAACRRLALTHTLLRTPAPLAAAPAAPLLASAWRSYSAAATATAPTDAAAPASAADSTASTTQDLPLGARAAAPAATATATGPSKPSKPASSDSFSLPSIFSSTEVDHHLIHYPWSLSTSPSREPTPTFWQALRDKHFLTVATKRVQDHLHHPHYEFPKHFIRDAGDTVMALLNALGDTRGAGDAETLEPVMVRGLARMYADGYRSLAAKGQTPSFLIGDTVVGGSGASDRDGSSAASSKALGEARKKMAVRLRGIHLTYGPYPVPHDYVAQDWFSFFRINVPREDSEFESHPRQKEVLKTAQDDGVFIRAKVVVDLPLEFVLTDTVSGIPLLRDRRDRIEVELVSPHFTPWDDVVIGSEINGWRLAFAWRVSDIDGLMAKREVAP
ncbi:hypothetical protein BC831DRAFT_517813 [Entophlyctis helioformis]|nr:hypothetical protein BC831DRAFT_517813 [Entophlyctis helioformis]